MSAKVKVSYERPEQLEAVRERLADCTLKEKPGIPKRRFLTAYFYLKDMPRNKDDTCQTKDSG